MSSHFSLKSLTFYGIAIGSVLILFKVVSAYGENNLKAPQAISGQYNILETQNLSSCLKELENIKIEQSGIYLLGKLSVQNQEIVLDGKLKGEQILFTAKPHKIAQCQAKDSSNSLIIQGQIKDKTFFGKMAWNSVFPETDFSAKLEESTQSTTEH